MIDSDQNRVFVAARDLLLAEIPDAWAAYLYGSFARGDEWPDSDVDIGVLLPPGKHLERRLDLMHTLSKQIGREVDLVSLRDVGLDLVQEVMRHGKALFVRRPEDTLSWEAERMTDYAQFNPRRAPILDLYLRQPLRTVR